MMHKETAMVAMAPVAHITGTMLAVYQMDAHRTMATAQGVLKPADLVGGGGTPLRV